MEKVNVFGYLADVKKPIDDPDKVKDVKNNDEITSLIFAPDPITGNPSSSLGMYLNEKTQPEVRQYIREHFLNSSGTGTDGYDDGDMVLNLSKSREESADQYLARLREFAQKSEEEC